MWRQGISCQQFFCLLEVLKQLEREKKNILAYRSHAKTHLDSAGVRELTEIAGLCPENRSDLVYWSRSEFQSQCCMHTYGRRWLRATMNTFVPLT